MKWFLLRLKYAVASWCPRRCLLLDHEDQAVCFEPIHVKRDVIQSGPYESTIDRECRRDIDKHPTLEV